LLPNKSIIIVATLFDSELVYDLTYLKGNSKITYEANFRGSKIKFK